MATPVRNVRWANVQVTGAAGATTGSATPAAGDTIILFAVINNGIVPTFTNSVIAGANIRTLTPAGLGPSTGARTNKLWIAMVDGINVTAVASTFHIDTGGVSTLISFGCTSYSGCASTFALDINPVTNAVIGGPSTALLSAVSAATAFPNEIVVACGFVDTAVGGTWTAGTVGGAYLNDGAAGTTAVGAGCAMGVESRGDSAISTKQADFAWTGSASPWVMTLLTLSDTQVNPPPVTQAGYRRMKHRRQGGTVTGGGGGGTNIANGQALTLSGAALGTKSIQAAPQLDDYGQDGVGPAVRWDRAYPDSTNPTFFPQNMQNWPTNYNPFGSAVGAPDPFCQAITAGAHYTASATNGPWIASVSKKIANFPVRPWCLYAAYARRIDPLFFFNGSALQLKQDVFGPASGVPADCIYIGVTPQPSDNTLVQVAATTNMNNSNVNTLETPDRNGHQGDGGIWSNCPNPFYVNGAYVWREIYICVDSTTGVSGLGTWKVFDNGVQVVNYAGRTDNFDTLNPTDRWLTLGPAVYSGSYGPPSATQPNISYIGRAIVDWSGTGVSTTVAKLLACDNAVFANAVKRRYQPVSSWTNTLLTLGPTGFRKCDFLTGQNVWFFAETEAGTVVGPLGAGQYTVT